MSFIARNIRSLQILLDLVLVALAWAFSYWLRFEALGGAQAGVASVFVAWFFPLAVLTLHFLLKNGHYERSRLLSVTQDLMQILRANAMSIVTFVVLVYFVSDGRVSRLTILLYTFVSTLFLIGGRVLLRSSVRKMRRRGYLLQRVFVAGEGPQIERYLKTIDYLPGTGFKVAGIFADAIPAGWNGSIHSIADLESEIAKEKPDIVVLGFSQGSEIVTDFIARHYDELFQIQVLVSENQSLLGMTAETIEDVHVLSLNQPRLSAPETFAKRMIDFVGSGIGLLLISPLLLVVGVLVKVTSSGPIFFGQERVGVDGAKFKMWKFRSMREAPPGTSSTGWTVENDPRRTRFGSFIRKTSIDELPQLWNVFVGDMSLVGPRPEQSYFVEKFRHEIPAYMLRHKMKAGITGWAQVNGWRGDTSLHKRIECDLYYIRNWTLWFDFKILVMTAIKGFINKNAY